MSNTRTYEWNHGSGETFTVTDDSFATSGSSRVVLDLQPLNAPAVRR